MFDMSSKKELPERNIYCKYITPALTKSGCPFFGMLQNMQFILLKKLSNIAV